ncbi:MULTISPECIES: XrtA/PEP-CTERM system histidine kinase PrsK [Sphingosinicellaceae]|uniref:XrtA/PEP-CTERM system histidine kinase PrsK n=1 Tax=Sphingosinicellaceae TaxID=2820280 RepID=UPI001C1DE44D|nr:MULTISPECIES: XrtA/PEP-CTERM system histidine kinase PrsK [Polymorphobacter]QYE34117.1 PEP-CTERM system histidine kinase PrsK [Polymorphobacter sp. PAMC 29334]UAJ09296.1 PEP-CTERM system histidine kinase PrsK [Polymorphobacter megasporae]
MQLTDVGIISHLIACVGFSALALSVLMRPQRDGASSWLVIAALVTAAWAGDFVLSARLGGGYALLLSPMETLRTASWIGFLVALLRTSWALDDRLSSSFIIASAIGFVTAMQFGLDFVDIVGSHGGSLHARPVIAALFVVGRLTVAISGLVLIHNLYVNAEPGSRIGIRLLCIGLAGFFVYDLNLYTLRFLLGSMSSDLFNIRGAVDAIVVPLLLLSARQAWVARVQVSRQVVFHTMSMSIIGGYLIIMALTAYGLRLVGGDWGRLLQITFLFATIILGSTVFVLPRYRAMLRIQISKHFFAYRYDYRTEWLRFIQTVSGVDADKGRLPERVVEAVCTVVDSPGGALFAPGDDGKFDVLAQWHYKGFVPSAVAVDGDLATFLTVRQRIVDLDELRDGEGDYDGLVLPPWAAGDRRAWLIVPLLYLDSLKGFIVVERTVVARTLNWEDFELLRTLGRQSASYIAEASTQAELDEAGKFDEFNRRFAFIMHDIKNLVSQLSLVARNAERHADNPAFRADMVATLQGSVGKMNDLLARLAQRTSGRAEHGEAVDLALLLAEIVSVKSRQHAALELAQAREQLFVTADPVRLEQLFGHLIQNAIEASQPGAAIQVDLRQDAATAVIEIADHGSGMSPAFVRNELFKPFRSTKAGGFGIGAYEARELVRAAGGRLDVTSREGEGSIFTIRLPLALLIAASQSRTGVESPMRISA